MFPKPVATSIDLTEGCNLACDYCFTHSKHKTRKLTFDMGKRIIDWWLPQTDPKKRVEIHWWGGEPLLEWKLLQKLVLYTEELNKGLGRNIDFGGTTNGILFTPDKVEWGMKHNTHFMVSLDGIKPVQNRHRKFPDGQGSFDIVTKNFKECKKVFPQLRARASISTFSVPYFFESIKYFVEELEMSNLVFSPVFEDDWNEKVLEELEEQFDLITNYAVQRAKDGKPVIMKHLYDEAVFGCSPSDPRNPCGAGNGYSGWSVDGFCFPCHRFNKHGISTEERARSPLIIARPKGDSFEWCNFEWRKQFTEFKDNPSEKCLACELFGNSNCVGGCYAVNWDMTRDIHNTPQSECDYSKIIHNAGIKYKKLMADNGLKLQERRKSNGCFCYNMCYTEGPGKLNELKKKFLSLSKRILETKDVKKTEEQIKLEQEILEKTIKIL